MCMHALLQALKRSAERAAKSATASAAEAKASALEAQEQLIDVRRRMPQAGQFYSGQDDDAGASPGGGDKVMGAKLPTLQQLAASQDKLLVSWLSNPTVYQQSAWSVAASDIIGRSADCIACLLLCG